MPPSLRIAALFLVAFCTCPPAPAQDAAKILDDSIKASGGSRALSKLLTVSFEGTVTRQSDAKSGTYTLHLKSPNRYYSEIVFNAQPEIFAYNGKSAWRENSAGEVGTLTGPDAIDLEAAAQLANSTVPLPVAMRKTGAHEKITLICFWLGYLYSSPAASLRCRLIPSPAVMPPSTISCVPVT